MILALSFYFEGPALSDSDFYENLHVFKTLSFAQQIFLISQSDTVRTLSVIKDLPVVVLKSFQVQLQLHDAIYRLRFYLNSLMHILSFSNSYNNVASLQKNQGDKSHRVIVASSCNYTMRFIGCDSIETH